GRPGARHARGPARLRVVARGRRRGVGRARGHRPAGGGGVSVPNATTAPSVSAMGPAREPRKLVDTLLRVRELSLLGVLAVIVIAIGAGFGAVNGALVSLGRVPSLVVTIGTLYIIRGLDFQWAKGRQINAADMPDGFLKIGSESILGIPILPLITVVVMLVA